MRIHYLQHVPFEGLGSMEPYFTRQGHQLSSSHLYRNDPFLKLENIDWLIVMGGPMGVYDDTVYPWLKKEKLYIDKAIRMGKTVLGVCLGAQLIADVLGAKVYKNKHREIGWFPILPAESLGVTILRDVFPAGMEVFHWHGDTFDIPKSAASVGSSEACANQGFVLEDRIVGLQFHLETTPASARGLIDNCREELNGSRYVQQEGEILDNDGRFSDINELMASVLQRLGA